MIPSPVYRIVTKRLIIRCYNPEDSPLFESSISESLEHLKPWMPWAHTESEETLQSRMRSFRSLFDQNQDFIYGIF